MLLRKETRPQMWKSGRETQKSKLIVAHENLRGRIAAMDGRRALFGWTAAIGLCALLAYILVDMALGGAA